MAKKAQYRLMKATIASSLVLLIALLGLASSNEAIHDALHGHDQETEFQCAVSLLKTGAVESSQPAITLRVATFANHPFPQTEAIFINRSDRALPPSCGPPFLHA